MLLDFAGAKKYVDKFKVCECWTFPVHGTMSLFANMFMRFQAWGLGNIMNLVEIQKG